MVAKKKNVRTDFSHADFAHILAQKGAEDLQKIAFGLITKLRKGNKNALSCLYTLIHFAHEKELFLLDVKQIELLADRVLIEFEYTNAIKQCLDLFKFAVGMLAIYPKEFARVVETMIDQAHAFINTLKKTRQMVALLPQVVKSGIQIKRKTFHNLMMSVYKNLAEFSSTDLCNLADYLTALLDQISKREGSHGIQLHDMLLLKKVNFHLSDLYIDFSFTSSNKDPLKNDENQRLRGMINRYLCALLGSLPECTDPLIEGQRPLIDLLRRGLFDVALTQFARGVAMNGLKDSLASAVVGEALKMLAYFVFPTPAHFAFTEERFLSYLRNAMFSTNEDTRKLAVHMAVFLVRTAWRHIHSDLRMIINDDDLPFNWLRDEHPDLLFELSDLLSGIIAAIPVTPLPFREKLIEVVSLYAMEDEDGDLVGVLRQAKIEELPDLITGFELTKNEELYLSVIFDSLTERSQSRDWPSLSSEDLQEN